jgi:DNA-binding protein YbaB|tara:strand:+ start:68 stop:313 length:246 start_codon:yes stop_codon:yes gene_type:complete
MPRKKTMTAKELTSQMTGMRLSKHEAICAERMKTLFKAIDEMRKDIKNLRQDMNKGKGAVSVLIFLAGIVAAIVGVFKWNG